MISAMIQAIHRDENDIVALNGQIISGTEARKHAQELFSIISNVKFKENVEELKKVPHSKQVFCNLYHPIKDEFDRIRTAIIVWDKNTPMHLIQSTIEVMGLDFEKWQRLYAKYQQRQRKIKIGFVLVVLVVLALILKLY